MARLYESLTSLQLFRGINAKDLAMISRRVHLRWANICTDQPFIQEGEPCNHLAILTQGEMLRTTTYDDMTYTVTELVKAPCIIEPEQIYGPYCTYRSNYRTRYACVVLLISKDDIRKTLIEIPIWRINLLNMYASTINKQIQKLQPKPYDLKEQIMHFGAERPLSLKIRMIDLAHYLGTSRTTISHALHELEREGKVRLTPNLIEYL